MLDTLIIGKDSKFGLTKDIEILAAALRRNNLGGRLAIVGIRQRSLWDWLQGRRLAETAIHIERIFPRWYSAARRHILIPNQERFPRRHLGRLKHVDLVLAKTHHAAEIFRANGIAAEYLGFTSQDRRDLSVERNWNRFVHLAGGSTLKGTEDILALWHKHPEWPQLTLVQKQHLAPRTVPANVTLISEFLGDGALRQIQNEHGIHLCPSRAEGWGHHLVEGMSVGALVIATNAAPMNEHVGPDSAILVECARSEPRHIGTSYFVAIDALEAAIERAIAMTEAEKARYGQAARLAFEQIDLAFASRLAALLGKA
ncbi:MAG: glycosyltransferase family 1 protein [Allorhizobium sp.]